MVQYTKGLPIRLAISGLTIVDGDTPVICWEKPNGVTGEFSAAFEDDNAAVYGTPPDGWGDSTGKYYLCVKIYRNGGDVVIPSTTISISITKGIHK